MEWPLSLLLDDVIRTEMSCTVPDIAIYFSYLNSHLRPNKKNKCVLGNRSENFR